MLAWLCGSLANGFIAGRLLRRIGIMKSAGIALLGMCLTVVVALRMGPPQVPIGPAIFAIAMPTLLTILAMLAFEWIERMVRRRAK
jgi:hypothetical protein